MAQRETRGGHKERNYLLENSGCDKLRDLNHRK